jgi:integrase
VSNHAKGVKQLYRANGLMLDLPRYPRTEQYPGRAPTQDELHRLLQAADPFERLLVLLPATAGFREGTMTQLTYGNLREDLEQKKDPVLVTVQPAITKGKGWETSGYWTFLPRETIDAVNECLEFRRIGSRGFPPETITDKSPILRNRKKGSDVRPISPQTIWFTVNQLYKKAGILKACPNKANHKRKGPTCADCGYPNLAEKRSKLCFHSLRWYFRTQLTSQGIDREYAEFMMGHKRAQYNDIRSKGPEFLREQYMKADFGITPKQKLNDRQVIEALLRARGFDPTRLLRTEAFDSEGYSEPHRLTVEDRNMIETRKLADLFAKSVLDQANNILSSSSKCTGSPGEIRTPVDGSLPG